MKYALGRFERVLRHRKPLVSFSALLICGSLSLGSDRLSSDFEEKFVCGEIMTYDDLKENGSEAAVKAAGKLRQQGKPYESEYTCQAIGRVSYIGQ